MKPIWKILLCVTLVAAAIGAVIGCVNIHIYTTEHDSTTRTNYFNVSPTLLQTKPETNE